MANHKILFLKEVFTMIYDELNEMEETNEYYGVSPLSYAVLNCAR